MIDLLSTTERERFTMEYLSVANPGAGNQWTVTVPENKSYIPLCLSQSITTDASVFNRVARVEYQVGGVAVAKGRIAANIVASTGQTVIANVNSGESSLATGGLIMVLPYCRLPAGAIITSNWQNLQAGDVLSGVVLTVLCIDVRQPT